MDDIEVIADRVRDLKAYYSTRDTETTKLQALRSGQWELLAPGAFTEDYPAPMVANRVDVMARDVAASLAQMPSISCAAAGGVSETQKKFAEKRTKIANHYVSASNLDANQTDAADSYNYYGMLVYFVDVDTEHKRPVIRVRSGGNVYAVWDGLGDTVLAAEEWECSRLTLEQQYPGLEAKMTESRISGERVKVVRYSDRKRTVMYLPEVGNCVLASYANPIKGRSQYVCVPRSGGTGSTFNSPPRGAYVDLIYPQLARHEFTNLMLEAAYKSVQAPVTVPMDVTSVPYGPDAVISTQNPQAVGRLRVDVPPGAFQAMQTLDQDLAIGGMSPESRTGNIQASVITGKGIEAASAGYSSQIANAQTMIAFGLRLAIQRCFMMDEALWPNTKREIRGIENGIPFVGSYIPSKDIAGDHSVEIAFGFMLGMAPNNALIFLLHAMSAGLISKDFAARQLPVGVNPTEEQRKVELESLRSGMLQSVAALAGAIPEFVTQGQDPGPILMQVSEVISRIQKGEAIEDIVKKVFAPSPPPEAPPGAPADPLAALSGGGAPPVDPSTPLGPGDRPDLQQFFAGIGNSGEAQLSGGVSRMDPVQR
ncbi:MAG: hypothetical protein ACRCSN_04760 [Dermatophilaceae bacterium]